MPSCWIRFPGFADHHVATGNRRRSLHQAVLRRHVVDEMEPQRALKDSRKVSNIDKGPIASTRKMSWCPPSFCESQRVRMKGEISQKAGRGPFGRLADHTPMPSPARAPSPSLYEATTFMPSINTGMQRGVWAARNFNQNSMAAQIWRLRVTRLSLDLRMSGAVSPGRTDQSAHKA